MVKVVTVGRNRQENNNFMLQSLNIHYAGVKHGRIVLLINTVLISNNTFMLPRVFFVPSVVHLPLPSPLD
jgi:hypothetical protein